MERRGKGFIDVRLNSSSVLFAPLHDDHAFSVCTIKDGYRFAEKKSLYTNDNDDG